MATTLPPGSSDAERFLDERLEQQLVEAGLTAQAASAIRNALQFVVLRLLFVLATKEEVSQTVQTATDTLRREMNAGFEAARRETDARFEGLRAEMTARFAEMDAKIEGLRAEMNARFAEMDAKIEGLRDEMNAKFDAQRRETRALFGVLITLVVALIVIVATRGA